MTLVLLSSPFAILQNIHEPGILIDCNNISIYNIVLGLKFLYRSRKTVVFLSRLKS